MGSAGRLVAMMPKKCDSAAIGMGMSVAKPEALITLVRKLKQLGTRLVLDASALVPQVLPEISGTDSIVTPHAGEYKRLFGADPGKDDKERIDNVRNTALAHSVTILLKGPVDIISNGKETGINKTHNSAMTVGGTGDVLSGITAALLAKKMKSFEAALLAVYLNGLSGNLAYRKLGLHITATDVVDNIAYAMKPFDKVIK
jgi:NAD(P)H-hydrate epimerase